MKFWNRKNKIEFFNSDPNITENFPIIESKDIKSNWVKSVRADFQKYAREIDLPNFEHLSRCPGIFDLFKYGYIITLQKDLIIKPDMKGGFEWIVPRKVEDGGLVVHHQSTALIANPPWAADFIVKIDTGWHVIAPKGIKFLMLPIAYPDTFDFTAAIGILDPSMATQVNFQMFWNGTDKETIIRAGTPLGHLIPLSEKKYQMVQRNMNQRDYDWLEKFYSLGSSTFWPTTIRKKMIDMYNNHWKG